MSVLSEENKVIEFSKYAEVLDTFIPFDINKKTLLSKIATDLEKKALLPEHYEQTMQLLSGVEAFLNEVAFDSSCDIVFPKLGLSAMIKSASPELRDEYDNLAEKILDYMELVTEYERKKMYITVNLRSYLSDEQVEMFAKTVASHGYNVLMVETCEKQRFSLEKRCIIDSDLCEIC